MSKIFIGIYNFFERHKVLFYCFLILCVGAMAGAVSKITFRQNVTDFFPAASNNDNTAEVFQNLNVKDKIVVLFSPRDGEPADSLINTAEDLAQRLETEAADYLNGILLRIDNNVIGGVSDFVYDHLPIFLTDSDYARFDTLITPEAIGRRMRQNYQNLVSPIGIGSRQYILRDPFGIGFQVLDNLQDLEIESDNAIVDSYLFTADTATLMLVLTPKYNMGRIGENEGLVSIIEDNIAKMNKIHTGVLTEYFGGASVSVYNARQIKNDTAVTSVVALLVIVVFISLMFKRKRTVPLIIVPAVFGCLFALAIIAVVKGEISSIAIGAGAAIIGIALSYSIHMLAHQNHVRSVEQLIDELAYPLTVGSFTTIGAFFALVFTSSALLRDFGLFASLTLIGTTLFCLIFLPHFLKGQADVKRGRVLRFIEKINAYHYEKNRWLVGALLVLIVVSCFTAGKVRFNSSMLDMYYEPSHLKAAREKLEAYYDGSEKTVMFVSVGTDSDSVQRVYSRTNRQLDSLKRCGLIKDYASAERFVVGQAEQERRIALWRDFWTPERRQLLENQLRTEAEKYHFKATAFNAFNRWFDTDFQTIDLSRADGSFGMLMAEWQVPSDRLKMLITQVRLADSCKQQVYSQMGNNSDMVVFDRAFFTGQWVGAVNDDFNWILFASSFLIFIALLISFGRIELTLMSFLPMLVSWFIILGVMGLFGIEFNIINIILSTFIFGIGDDFSIFIMDGLQSKYRTGRQTLDSHKTAIFCSAFTIVVGMGALMFAQHPALQSISLLSILGMLAVVLVAFTIQPIIFNFFIANPAAKGNMPYTVWDVLLTAIGFGAFVVSCIVLRLLTLILYVVPVKRIYKRRLICLLMTTACRMIFLVSPHVKIGKQMADSKTFETPGIVIANHQSFMDILSILAVTPRVVMVTNKWVWRSPVFGGIIRYVGFIFAGDGVENNLETVEQRIAEGFSVVIFPEGTRSADGHIGRFHKGAFMLAESLKLDIVPVLLYGTADVIPKNQPFIVRRGQIVANVMPRICYTDRSWGNTYQERTKSISAWFKTEYKKFYDSQNTTASTAIYSRIMHNFIFKGPVEEWYLRVKIRMEGNYELFDRIVPRRARITDIGCGFGPLCYMLAQTSADRDILGLDYDADKIAVAQHGWLRQHCHLRFEQANALDYDLPQSDVFIMNDMLHYMSAEHQSQLIHKCVAALADGGQIIIRDGNTEEQRRHRLTRFTELMSTRIIKFNKTEEQLVFLSETRMRQIAADCGMTVETIQNDRYTSNTIYILKRV